jgi:serine/threonine-protein kinase
MLWVEEMAMSDPAQDPAVGSRFGPYELKRRLGSGRGEVYAAYNNDSGRTVALKLLPAELSHEPSFGARLQREVYSAAKLTEPHVIPIHGTGRIEGRLYVEMRLIPDCTDLATALERDGAMRPQQAVEVVCQIAAALDAAHHFGLVHRDVKPENILLARNDFAYLTDFGIVTTNEMTTTSVGPPMETYAYMAPERFADRDSDYPSDIYSLACVLYECLTGSTPYPEKSLQALIAAHLMQPMPRPSQAHLGIPSGFDEVIARGMAKTPEDRYASAGELGRAARSALTAG